MADTTTVTAARDAAQTRLNAIQAKISTAAANLVTNELNHAIILQNMDIYNLALKQTQAKLDALNAQLGVAVPPDPILP